MRLLPFIVLDVVLGFIIPHINIAAHIGGLGVGFATGLILPPAIYADGERESYGVKVTAATVFVGLTVLSGAVTIGAVSLILPQIAERRAKDEFRFLYHPSAELPEYIDRVEQMLHNSDYTRESYSLLAGLYWEALRTDPENSTMGWKISENFMNERFLRSPDDTRIGTMASCKTIFLSELRL